MRKGLGKGLGALIPLEDDEFEEQKEQKQKSKIIENVENIEIIKDVIQEIKITDIEPNKNQPRKFFNEEELQSLANSIKEHGVIQPIIITKNEDKYLIVTGERRWRAARLAGLKTIPAIVKEFAGRKLMEVAIIENIQRQDLNPIEEAEALHRLLNEYELTQEELAKSVSKSRGAIANTLRLLSLDDRVKEMVISGKLSEGHARTLVPLDREIQYIIAQELEKRLFNVRETELYIKKILEKAENSNTKKDKKDNLLNDIEDDISERLKNILGTKVKLKTANNKGKIIIDYYSNEDLERLLEVFYSIGK